MRWQALSVERYSSMGDCIYRMIRDRSLLGYHHASPTLIVTCLEYVIVGSPKTVDKKQRKSILVGAPTMKVSDLVDDFDKVVARLMQRSLSSDLISRSHCPYVQSAHCGHQALSFQTW